VSTATRRESPPFLDAEPPPWAIQSLATVLLLLFACGIAIVFVVQIPETISATFVVEPVRGTDPVRSLHRGTVTDVRVSESQTVAEHDILFVLASEQVGDRVAERDTVNTRLSGGRGRLGNERAKYESQRRADEQERHRIEQKLAALDRQAQLKSSQLALSRDVADRRRREYEAGVVSWLDANRPRLEVDQLESELEALRADGTDAKNALSRLAYEMTSRRAGFSEIERGIREDMTTFQARKDMLERDALRDGNAMGVPAPCAGTIVKLHVRQAGAVVDENDLMAEVVCGGEPLRADLRLPERGLALARVGQPVKLLYDAFPYERYGVQYGTLRWLSPASAAGPQGPAFRAFADLGADRVGAEGRAQAVLPGMTGRAAIIVGRRTIAGYAIEPVRQLRESLSSAPPAGSAASRPIEGTRP